MYRRDEGSSAAGYSDNGRSFDRCFFFIGEDTVKFRVAHTEEIFQEHDVQIKGATYERHDFRFSRYPAEHAGANAFNQESAFPQRFENSIGYDRRNIDFTSHSIPCIQGVCPCAFPDSIRIRPNPASAGASFPCSRRYGQGKLFPFPAPLRRKNCHVADQRQRFHRRGPENPPANRRYFIREERSVRRIAGQIGPGGLGRKPIRVRLGLFVRRRDKRGPYGDPLDAAACFRYRVVFFIPGDFFDGVMPWAIYILRRQVF